MEFMSFNDYLDRIDVSSTQHFTKNYGTTKEFKENRVLRGLIIDLIEPHMVDIKTVLDVGVGQGINSLFYLRNDNIKELIGIDNDTRLLDMFLENADMLGVIDKVKAFKRDLIYGVDPLLSPDFIYP